MHGKPRQRPPRHSSSRVVSHASIAGHDCRPNWRAKRLILSPNRSDHVPLMQHCLQRNALGHQHESSAWHITRLNAASRVLITRRIEPGKIELRNMPHHISFCWETAALWAVWTGIPFVTCIWPRLSLRTVQRPWIRSFSNTDSPQTVS